MSTQKLRNHPKSSLKHFNKHMMCNVKSLRFHEINEHPSLNNQENSPTNPHDTSFHQKSSKEIIFLQHEDRHTKALEKLKDFIP